eukprot:CAMPEP_0179365956 /NCGR_PEP_ID=MMETSP0797-20121207/82815_1 /TAXON_ID=47934 /ORGANISM="Dinophysis acuminata, Strain DAEP01" /LENGTH=53 /DNA_ID=CAMNT_0021081469 /DNA_START=60 /DNA_END=217 /DNA_ORIENTATION=+
MVPVFVLPVGLGRGLQLVGHVMLAAGAGLEVVRVLGGLLEAPHEVLGVLAREV